MAKNIELTEVKKGLATFNLIGKAKVGDFTFSLDQESQKSDWIYSKINLGVDCGVNGIIYADMMGGYGSDRDNYVYVHGVDKDGKDDYNNNFKIDWEDRFDETIFDTIGNNCFITVGLEKDENGKTVYKKFLSEYDAINYINDNLQDGTIINVKGNLQYQKYNDNLSVKKNITSIVLSKAEEDKFKATFTQTLLVESDAVGKPDKDTMTIPITATLIEYMKEFDGKKIFNGKTNKQGMNIPIMKEFYVQINEEDKNKTTLLLKQFKAKSKKVTEIVVDGIFTRGALETTEVKEDDIPDDIKELIEMGIIDKEDVLGKIAFANGGNKPERMIITNPNIKMIEVDDGKRPSINRVADKYTQDDINPILVIEQFGYFEDGVENDTTSDCSDEVDIDDLMKETTSDDNDDDDDSWLKDL